MGTGQMMLTIVAIVLLGSIIVNTDSQINSSSQVLLQTSFGIDATSLGTSIIEKAEELPFDENTRSDSTGSGINNLNALTLPANLGQEKSDTTDLDDYDDFNGLPSVGYRIETDTLATGIYKVKTEVHYVSRLSNGSLQYSSSATWTKQLDIWVWNTLDTRDTVKMSDVYSYWF